MIDSDVSRATRGEGFAMSPEDVVADVSEGAAPTDGAMPESGGGDSKFVAALKEAKLENWAETATRWDKERSEAKAALKAREDELATLREQIKQASAKSGEVSRRDDLIARAVKQGYKRSNVNDYLDTHTLEDLESELDADAAKETGGNSSSPDVAKMMKKIQALEDRLRLKEEDADLSQQLMGSLDEFAKDQPDDFRQLVGGLVAQEVELARARHQKLPNIKEAVNNAVNKLSKFATNIKESAKKEFSKGAPTTTLAEKPDIEFQKQLSNEDADVQEAVKLMRAVRGD